MDWCLIAHYIRRILFFKDKIVLNNDAPVKIYFSTYSKCEKKQTTLIKYICNKYVHSIEKVWIRFLKLGSSSVNVSNLSCVIFDKKGNASVRCAIQSCLGLLVIFLYTFMSIARAPPLGFSVRDHWVLVLGTIGF